MNRRDIDELDTSIKLISGALLTAGTIAFVSSRYKYAKPGYYLMRVGFNTGNQPQVGRTFIRWPFQSIHYINLSPTPINFKVLVITKDNLNLSVPFNLTVAPKISYNIQEDTP